MAGDVLGLLAIIKHAIIVFLAKPWRKPGNVRHFRFRVMLPLLQKTQVNECRIAQARHQFIGRSLRPEKESETRSRLDDVQLDSSSEREHPCPHAANP